MNTRERIVAAFNRLVVATQDVRPPIAQVLKEANVARSTFYNQFDDRDALLLEAMVSPLTIIADEIARHGDGDRLAELLLHFWEQRHGGRALLQGQCGERLVRALAKLVAERFPDLDQNDILRIADAQIALLRLWLFGATPDSASKLAHTMIATARAQRAAYSQ